MTFELSSANDKERGSGNKHMEGTLNQDIGSTIEIDEKRVSRQ